MDIQRYNKFIVALVTAVIAGLSNFYGPTNELVVLLVTLAGAFGVYAVPNRQ